MSNPYPDSELFKLNRRRLIALMDENSMAILFSNDLMPRNGDQFFPFRQSSDLFYLTGIDQEETILLLFPECPLAKYREVLFIRKVNEQAAIWEGNKYTQQEAERISGIKTVMWNESFDDTLKLLSTMTNSIYFNSNEHTGAPDKPESLQMRKGKQIKEKYPFHQYLRLAPLMKELRLIKQEQEVKVIQHACDITASAFKKVLQNIKRGMNEYEVEADLTREFLYSGARGHAYAPIVAAGKNASILHYTKNNSEITDGDLLLFDVGCEYYNYASDMSRTIPVSGRFTMRQKEAYNAVLRVFKQARAMMKPGTTIDKINKKVEKLLQEEHIKLGLYTCEDVKDENEAERLVKKYYPHGTSHFMGLDVHDVGTKYERLEAGMVLSCEPGIYISEENIGIRIENDILVTLDEPVDLMKDVPLEAEEIEETMNKKG